MPLIEFCFQTVTIFQKTLNLNVSSVNNFFKNLNFGCLVGFTVRLSFSIFPNLIMICHFRRVSEYEGLRATEAN